MCPIAMDCGPAGGLRQVKRNYEEGAGSGKAVRKGQIHIARYQKEFVAYSMKLAGVAPGDLKGLKIYGEFLSGTGGMDFALAMDLAGAELTLSHIIPNGLFLQGDPNPIEEETISPVREIVRQGDYDIGFCFDGDGDRMDLMYPDGSQVIPGLNMAMLVPYIREIYEPYFGEGTVLKAYVDVKAVPPALAEIAKQGWSSTSYATGTRLSRRSCESTLKKVLRFQKRRAPTIICTSPMIRMIFQRGLHRWRTHCFSPCSRQKH